MNIIWILNTAFLLRNKTWKINCKEEDLYSLIEQHDGNYNGEGSGVEGGYDVGDGVLQGAYAPDYHETSVSRNNHQLVDGNDNYEDSKGRDDTAGEDFEPMETELEQKILEEENLLNEELKPEHVLREINLIRSRNI